MRKFVQARLMFVLLVGAALFLLTALRSFGGQSSSAPAQTTVHQDAYSQPTDPSLYVGEDTCKTCHADMPTKGFVEHFETSRHFVTTFDNPKKGPQWHGWESCHGPGKAHVDGGDQQCYILVPVFVLS